MHTNYNYYYPKGKENGSRVVVESMNESRECRDERVERESCVFLCLMRLLVFTLLHFAFVWERTVCVIVHCCKSKSVFSRECVEKIFVCLSVSSSSSSVHLIFAFVSYFCLGTYAI